MIPFDVLKGKTVSAERMNETYEMLKTPYKYGAVMKINGKMCDSPTVYRHQGKWYMSFIQIDNQVESSGYDSHIAESSDLLRWIYKGERFIALATNNFDKEKNAGLHLCYSQEQACVFFDKKHQMFAVFVLFLLFNAYMGGGYSKFGKNDRRTKIY